MADKLDDNIKELLMLDDTVYSRYKSFLTETINNTKDELALLLEETEVPEAYLFIVKKVVIKRFNMRKNEGMKAASSGETTVQYQEDDFAEYRQLIKDYVDKKNNPNLGVVNFL